MNALARALALWRSGNLRPRLLSLPNPRRTPGTDESDVNFHTHQRRRRSDRQEGRSSGQREPKKPSGSTKEWESLERGICR
eukprot:scaffold1954_cov268-Pinguiococcus_pyrenoidosus.AAC.59